MSLPSILYVCDLRRVLDGWSRDRIRGFLRANGLAMIDGRGFTYTTDAALRERMPDAHRAMSEKWEAMRERREPDYAEDFSDLD